MLLIQTHTEADIYRTWIICGLILVYLLYMNHLKKVNPLKHKKISSTVWGIFAVLFLFWLIGKWRDDDKK